MPQYEEEIDNSWSLTYTEAVNWHLSTILAVILSGLTSCAFAQDAKAVYKKAAAGVLKVEVPDGSGTGFAIGDGTLVITCAHVINGVRTANDIKVAERPVAAILAFDFRTDVAVLLMAKRFENTIAFQKKRASPGTKVYCIGYPLGMLGKSITEGIISGVRSFDDWVFYQNTVPISPGSSGSPLLDSSGKVVGLAQATLSIGQQNNFAVASETIRPIVDAAMARKLSIAPDRPGTNTVLGKLGQALEEFKIYAEPRAESRAYYIVQPFEYVVINQGPNEKWYLVLMQNGKYGYADSSKIAKLPYDVTQNQVGSSTPVAADNPLGNKIAEKAIALAGDKERKLSTSALVIKELFKEAGVLLPDSLKDQMKKGDEIKRLEELQSGDRLYFDDVKGNSLSQAGIYIGNGYFVYVDKLGVAKTQFLTESWRSRLIGARRTRQS